MLAIHVKRSLFGGALRCAGLFTATCLTSAANADFGSISGPVGANYTFNYAVDPAGGFLIHAYDNNNYGFPNPTSYSGSYGTLSAYSNQTLIGARVTPGSPSWGADAGAIVRQSFVSFDDKKVRLEWDFTASNGFSFASVYEFGFGYLAMYTSGAGSISLTLTAGNSYFFIGKAATNTAAGAGGDVYVRLYNVIPAPGALAMLGLGMIGTRRRRRE